MQWVYSSLKPVGVDMDAVQGRVFHFILEGKENE